MSDDCSCVQKAAERVENTTVRYLEDSTGARYVAVEDVINAIDANMQLQHVSSTHFKTKYAEVIEAAQVALAQNIVTAFHDSKLVSATVPDSVPTEWEPK